VNYGKDSGVYVVKWDYIAEIMYDKSRLSGLKNVGYSCVKVDFFYRTDQQATEVIDQLADDAAKLGLTLLLHGCPVPHGLHRTYPNILSYEAVTGEENYKWDEKREGGRLPTAKYHVEIPFIRQLVGPMDYTPGSMRNVHLSAYRPIWSGIPKSIGTRAHELAMYVMYDMYIAYLCDNPMEYGKHPEVMDFFAKVPTTWDESIALDGKVGEYAMVAKRKGTTWFVAGMGNADPHTLKLDFSFLMKDSTSDARIFKDVAYETDKDAKVMAVEDFTVKSTDKLSVSCTKEGGFVLQLYKKTMPKDPNTDPEIISAVSKSGVGDKRSVLVYRSADSMSLTVKSASAIRAISIVNLQGAVVAQQSYPAASLEEKLSIAQLISGLYVVSVETASGAYTAKFFK
jgi:alpha-glucosidase